MDMDQFAARLRGMLGADFPAPPGPDSPLELDSLQAYELMIATESLAGCYVPPEDAPRLDTLGAAYAYYRRLQAEAA